jgi:alpha-L-arabinofuranosidase
VCKFIHRIMKYANKISAMKAVDQKGNAINLAWAVLSLNKSTGRSDVIKVTDYEEADNFVQNDPELYYKSGPFAL